MALEPEAGAIMKSLGIRAKINLTFLQVGIKRRFPCFRTSIAVEMIHVLSQRNATILGQAERGIKEKWGILIAIDHH